MFIGGCPVSVATLLRDPSAVDGQIYPGGIRPGGVAFLAPGSTVQKGLSRRSLQTRYGQREQSRKSGFKEVMMGSSWTGFQPQNEVVKLQWAMLEISQFEITAPEIEALLAIAVACNDVEKDEPGTEDFEASDP